MNALQLQNINQILLLQFKNDNTQLTSTIQNAEDKRFLGVENLRCFVSIKYIIQKSLSNTK